MEKFRIGIVGLGVISKYYIHALDNLEEIELVAVCDINLDRMSKFKELGIDCYVNYKDLLKRNDIHGVIVNVPNNMHYEICKESLLSGKNVCCEKPLTINLADASDLVNLSKSVNETLFTAFHRRYNINFISYLEKQESLENIKSVRGRYFEDIEEHAGDDKWYLVPEKCGGGCIADNGPNVFDTLSFFLGKMKVVNANVIRDDRGIDMEAYIDLENENGLPIRVELDWRYSLGEKKDLLIIMSDGRDIYIDMLQDFEEFKSSLHHEYKGILMDFYNKVKEGKTFGEDGYDAVRLVNEVYSLEKRIITN